MLYALGTPLSFFLLVALFLVLTTVSGWITAVVAARCGQRSVRLEGRTRPDPRRQVDPFGAVSGLIAGFGWARPVDVPRMSPARVAGVVLAGPAVLLVAGLGALAGFGAVYGAEGVAVGTTVELIGGSNLLQEGAAALTIAQEAWLLSGLMATWVGALSFVPLPPLPGGQVLFAAAPRTLGWQKAEYQLVERNIGTAVLLALMLIPLGSAQALLPNVLNTLLGPLVRLVSGG